MVSSIFVVLNGFYTGETQLQGVVVVFRLNDWTVMLELFVDGIAEFSGEGLESGGNRGSVWCF